MLEKAGFNTWGDLFDKPLMYTSKEIIEMIKGNKTHDSVIKDFKVTLDICPSAKFNDDTRQMILADHIFVYVTSDPQNKRPENYTLFSYDQIVSFELLENGESVASGGIGRAALGGMLFGGVGAIVGASTRSYKSVCEELKVKVTVKDYKEPRPDDAPKRDIKFDENGNIVVKNPSAFWLPDVKIVEEIGGTEITVTGSYEGTETLDKKLKRIMEQNAADDENGITEDSE